MSGLVLTDRVGPVAVVTLNRPERHNSLVPELLEELLAALCWVEAQTEVQAAVLFARGRSFSTGGDMAVFHDHLAGLEDYARTLVGLLNRSILALTRLRVPAVAAVHGIVTGGSLGLVLGCDVVLVAPQASFTPYYSVVGFSPDGGWTALLPAVVGARRAAEVLLCNATISAEEAVAWGLAHRLVPAERIQEQALQVAQDIAAKKPGSIAHTRDLLRQVSGGSDLAVRLEGERQAFVQQIGSPEARQGIVDFQARAGRPRSQS